MKNIVNLLVFILVLTMTTESLAQEYVSKLSTYISPYVGLAFQESLETEQNSVAHKRGNFNAFDTDFDLVVDVKGISNQAIGYVFGLTYGSVWQKKNSKWKPGFEFDLFYTKSNHESKLVNPKTEEVTNVNGDSLNYIIELVEEHYGAGHHKFSNKMEMTSLNTAINFTLSYSINDKVSIYGALGLGFSVLTMTNAESKQSSPASANSDYEITKVTGGPVNHFNSQTKSSSNLMFAQFRLGTKISLSHHFAVCIDARGMYRGKSEFTFGSTKYTDHPPTDNWRYSIGNGVGIVLTTGLIISL